jgi:hypothetical protein
MTTTSSARPDQIQDILDLLNPCPSTSSEKWWTFIDKTDVRLWSITAVTFAGAIVVGIYRKYFHTDAQWSFHLFYLLLIVSQLCSQAVVLRHIYGQFKGLLRPVETLFSTINPIIVRDYQTLTKLRKYDSVNLEFLAKRLKLEASQFRKRIGYVAPGIERIGLVPSALAGSLSFLKQVDSKDLPSWLHLPSDSVVGIVVAISVVYFSGLILALAAQRIDQLAQVVSLAVENQEKNNGKTSTKAESHSDEDSEDEHGQDEEQDSDNENARSDINQNAKNRSIADLDSVQ